MKKMFRFTAIALFALSLFSSCKSSNGLLSFNQRSITVVTGSSREILITLSGSKGVVGLHVTIVSSNPSVATVSPAHCILSSEPGSPQSCEITVYGVANGSAIISATAPGYTVAPPVYVTVSDTANVPGNLSFSKSSESITVGSTNHVTLSLDNSSGVSSLVVTLSSSNSGIATTTPTSCTLSSGTNSSRSCEIDMNGIALGTATITASASGYNSPTVQADVISGSVTGSIAFVPTTVSVGIGESKVVSLDLNNSSGVSVTASVSSSNTAFATVSPASCNLASAVASRHCSVTITGVAVGSLTVGATATDYTITPVNVTVTQQYEPATQFGVFNNCGYTIWMQAQNPPVGAEAIVELASGKSHDYAINGQYLEAFRVWPKTGCDVNGQNCNTGQQNSPCQNNVCQPPIDSLWEGTFNDPSNYGYTTHDNSLVNGFTLPFTAPVYKAGSDLTNSACISSDASTISVNSCPTNDNLSIAGSSGVYGAYGFGPYTTYINGNGDTVNLASVNEQSTYPTTNQVEGCMAPTTVMTYSTTFGGLFLGANSSGYTASLISPVILYSCGFNTSQLKSDNPSPATIQPGQATGFDNLSGFCNANSAYCPSSDANGPAASQVCNLGPINDTQYVQYVHANTTNIYAQTFDDTNGTSTCFSPQTKYAFIICPTN